MLPAKLERHNRAGALLGEERQGALQIRVPLLRSEPQRDSTVRAGEFLEPSFPHRRYEKHLEQEEQALQQQRRRLYSEVAEEKERLNQQAAR